MVQLSTRVIREQESHAAKALGYPTGDLVYVDSNAGNDGNDGTDKEHAVKTLTRGLALAQAGDTIILGPGGSETLTGTLAITLARLKIVCPVTNAHSGFVITGAGSLDLLTWSGADGHLEGVKFTRTAGAGAATASVLVTAAADRFTAKNCLVDNTALTSAWTNFGIEFTDDCLNVHVEDCEFRDCHRGVVFTIASGKTQIGWTVLNSTFWVGQATAFGIHCNPTSTGTSSGYIVKDCHFHEGDSDGGAATDVWDGATGADAASGPVFFGALADRGAVVNCTAYTALARAFDLIAYVHATSLTDLVGNVTATGGDIQTTVDTISSETTVIQSDSIIIESSIQVVESETTVLQSDSIIIESSIQVVESETTVLQSDSIIIESSIQVVESETTVLQSDSIIIESSVQVIESDLILVQVWQPKTARSAAVVLTGGTVGSVFTVAGGPVLVVGLFAHVDTVVDAACTAQWTHTPTVGSATALCATVDANTDAVGDVFYVIGPSATALTRAATGTAAALGTTTQGQFLMPGTIDLTLQNSDPTTGEWDVYVVYIPLTATSTVT